MQEGEGGLFENFEALPEEKRNRIIRICVEEFAEHGYTMASTNHIIERAGISKGILFHYFGNKKNLFLYIVNHAFSFYMQKIKQLYLKPSQDLFERLAESSLVKLRMFAEDSILARFYMNAFTNPPDELKKELKDIYDIQYRESVPFVVRNDIDTGRFRKGVDPEKAFKMLLLFFQGLSTQIIELYRGRKDIPYKEIEERAKEVWDYIEIMKYGIYEKENEEV